MTAALHGTGDDQPRAGVKRPPRGAVGRCRCWRTGPENVPEGRS